MIHMPIGFVIKASDGEIIDRLWPHDGELSPWLLRIDAEARLRGRKKIMCSAYNDKVVPVYFGGEIRE